MVRASPEMHPCNYCKELGYWRRDCPKRKAKGKEEEAKVQTVQAISANLCLQLKYMSQLKSMVSQ